LGREAVQGILALPLQTLPAKTQTSEKNQTLYIFKLPHALNDEDVGKNAKG